MKHILINPVCRAGSACIKEIEIGKKVIKSIQTLPKLQTKNDVNLIFDNEVHLPNFDGLVLDLWSLSDMHKSLFVGEGQRRLDNNEIAVTKVKLKMGEKVLIIDPNSEEFHYPYQISKDKKTGEVVTRKNEILGLKGFPSAVSQVFNEFGKDAAWRTLENRKLLLSFIDWYIEYCIKFGVDVILPPAPLIDGKSQSMLDIVHVINKTTLSVTKERTESCSAIYVPIASSAFKDDAAPERIASLLDDIAQHHSIIALKIHRTGEILDHPIARNRLKTFLMFLDSIKQDFDDDIALMVLDTKSEGVAYFGAGIDLTCDPFGGVKDSIHFGKRKREDSGDEDRTGSDEFKHFGRWYHPTLREYLNVGELKSIHGHDLALPHECPFCMRLGNILAKEKDEPGFPRQDQWNSGRRLHNFICQREEDELIREELRMGNPKAVELFLSEKGRGNKNLIDLLP